MRASVFLLALWTGTHALAADERPPPLEPLPEPGLEEEALHPEVVIRRRGRNVIEEYRLGGRLYLIKVIPPIGPPYYLVDSDGDGRFARRSDLETTLRTHQWRILEW